MISHLRNAKKNFFLMFYEVTQANEILIFKLYLKIINLLLKSSLPNKGS